MKEIMSMSKIIAKMWVAVGLLLMLTTGTTYAAYDAGTVKMTKGSATIERGDEKITAKPGIKVQVLDRIITGTDSSIGITLHDGTLLSAGQNSSLNLNKFSFDSNTNKGALDAYLNRGTLAVVSGTLSKTSREAVTYRTPRMELGVRGTEFILDAGTGKE